MKDSGQNKTEKELDQYFWPFFDLEWDEKAVNAKELEQSLQSRFSNNTNDTYFNGVVSALGYTKFEMAKDAVDYQAKGIRQMMDEIAPNVNVWFSGKWWNIPNVVAVDYFMSSNIVEIAKSNNLKRGICLKVKLCPNLMPFISQRQNFVYSNMTFYSHGAILYLMEVLTYMYFNNLASKMAICMTKFIFFRRKKEKKKKEVVMTNMKMKKLGYCKKYLDDFYCLIS